MTNRETEAALRTFLTSRGFGLNDELIQNGATGTDIIAKAPNGRTYYIEVIGYKISGAARSRDFCEGVFRTMSRIRLGADMVVLACPFTFQDGLHQRIENQGEAWMRLGSAFLELELWFVYPTGTQISYASWNYWGRKVLQKEDIIYSSRNTAERFGAPVPFASEEFHRIYDKYYAPAV